MSVDNVIRNRAVLLETIGRSALNIRYPKEFELYVVALELMDQDGATLRYFVFPVNPSGLSEVQPEITNVRKTLGGITSLSNTTFVPVNITVSGNFGRKFKILLGTDYVEFINSFTTINNGVASAAESRVTANSLAKGSVQIFDERTKTGYGCLKILEDIKKEAKVVDEKGSRRLVFYNPVFGTSYLVKPTSFRIEMSQESNMLHNYTIQFEAIAPLESFLSERDMEKEAKRLNTTAYLQSETNRVINQLTAIIA